MAYGLTDDLEVRLAESFSVSGNDQDNDLKGTTAQFNSNGFSDPNFGITYRVIDQRHHEPVDLDFAMSYAPNMISDSAPGGGHDGAESAGGQVAAFGATLGREMKDFTIAGSATATYHGKREYEALATDDDISPNSFWAYEANLQTQTRITSRFSIDAGVAYYDFDNYTAANQTTGLTWIGRNPDYANFSVGFNYHFIPNRLVGQLSYNYDLYTTNGELNNYSTPSDNSYIKYEGNNIFGAKLFYTFE